MPRDPQSPLRITFSPATATLTVTGVIDESTHQLFAHALRKAAAGPARTVCIDMSRVEFCDLAGLRAIVALAGSGGSPERIALAGLSTEGRTMMCILGWDEAPGLTVLPAGPGGYPEAR